MLVQTNHAQSPHELMGLFIVQLAVVLIAARVTGSFVRKYMHLPRVAGELFAGMLIGPYALGGFDLPYIGPLFGTPNGVLPVSTELYAIATFASVVLLFLAGLETDLASFLRYSFPGTVIGIGGAVVSFVLGDGCAVVCGVAESYSDPHALLLGVTAMATSVGISVRVLSEKNRMDAPESVTIMAAAVFDDVFCIILTSLVVGIGLSSQQDDGVRWSSIGVVALKTMGIWLFCAVLVVLSGRKISALLAISREPATIAALSLGLALLVAGLSEMAGLAIIIGAYLMGLSLSRTDIVLFLQNQLRILYEITVPIFFCVMGMLVDVTAIGGVLWFSAAYTVCAVASKLLGCALPALCLNYTWRGALRIGFGMLPRAEVALIVAGMGLATGLLSHQLFGAVVMMSMATMLMAPPLLHRSLSDKPGVRGKGKTQEPSRSGTIRLDLPSPAIAEFLLTHITSAFADERFFVSRLGTDLPTYQMRKEDMVFTMVQDAANIALMVGARHQALARLIITEELLSLRELFEGCSDMKWLSQMQNTLLKDAFGNLSDKDE